jgi:hypothetical protein
MPGTLGADSSAQAPKVTPTDTAFAEAGAAVLPDPIDAHTSQLAADAADPLKAWLDIIKKMLDGADSLEAFQAALVNGYGDLPSDEMTKVMGVAFAAADLAGRFDVSEGR